MSGNSHGLSLLKNAGADLDKRDDLFNTPAHYAAAKGHNQCFDYLAKNGADLTLHNLEGQTSISLFEGCTNNAANVIQSFAKKLMAQRQLKVVVVTP